MKGGIKMTIEELEIIVTAKVEEALKEVKKIIPAIKETMKQTQDAFSKVSTKEMKKQVQQAVQFSKKQIQDLKKSIENNEIKIKVTNADAMKQIKQVKKELDILHKEQTARKY